MIAGRLPNRAPALAAFVRDAPSLVPGTAMPPIPMKDSEARDIAAWLHGLRER
jgi:cytochrome c1